MTLAARLKKNAYPVWEKIFHTPFVVELYKGTLPEEKFKFYVKHDYNYIIGSIKNFSILASKADTAENTQLLTEIAREEATTEFAGYKEYLKKLEISLEEVENTEPTFIETSYVSFLQSTSLLKTFAEGITAVLPCYWSYSEIAKFHKNKLQNNPNKLYREWASLYLEEDYLEVVRKIINIVDHIPSDFHYHKLKKVFLQASKYELLFWKAAYNLEEWPV